MVRFAENIGSPAVSGGSCAGVCVNVLDRSSSYVINAMVGGIVRTDDSGELFYTVENASSYTMSDLVNAMTGSVSSTGPSGSSGGIASSIQRVEGVFTMGTVANYMSGSIPATLEAEGLAGTVAGSGIGGGTTIVNSV